MGAVNYAMAPLDEYCWRKSEGEKKMLQNQELQEED